MYTAEIVRRQQMAAHWRLYEQQFRVLEACKPIALLLGEKLREAYPDLMPPVSNGEGK